jgi:NAD(P)-dependent dehydrogenase (short-subunit alcohol dehydrogenase family)
METLAGIREKTFAAVQDEVALVTGGGSDIGLALRDGWERVVTRRRKNELDTTVAPAKSGGARFTRWQRTSARWTA